MKILTFDRSTFLFRAGGYESDPAEAEKSVKSRV